LSCQYNFPALVLFVVPCFWLRHLSARSFLVSCTTQYESKLFHSYIACTRFTVLVQHPDLKYALQIDTALV